uniref:Protein-tyrosine phosphatase receptor IA-2 ectodomain domain-containing protein n=1 Tax=Strigamia maritima TaxID=126957 RepID=T1JCS7_STRMM
MGGFLALLAILSGYLPLVKSEGNIGCLFTDSVCKQQEWCFDDSAFGRCLSTHVQQSASSYYQYDFKLNMLRKLEEEMNRLFSEGYSWSHAYTQCILQNLLNSQRYGFDYQPSLCSAVAGMDQSAMDFQPEMLPRDLAVIHFDPTTGLDQLSEFASEWFIPPLNHDRPRQPKFYGSARRYSTDDLNEDRDTDRKMSKRYKNPSIVQDNDKEMLDFLDLLIDQTNDVLPDAAGDKNERMDSRHIQVLPSRQIYSDVSPEEFDQLQALFSASAPVQASQEYHDGEGEWIDLESDNKPMDIDESEDSFLAQSGGDDENYWNSGFKRLHRYDVKKPGPNFMNNLDDFDSTEAVVNEQLQQASLFKVLEDLLNNKTHNIEAMIDQKFTADGMSHENSAEGGEREYETHVAPKSTQEKEKYGIPLETSKRRNTANGRTPSLYGIHVNQKDLPVEVIRDYDVIDTSYAYITVEKEFGNWKKGAEFVRKLEKLLQLPEDTFSNIRVDGNQVTFKVNQNPHGLNGSIVAVQAESLKNELLDSTGKRILSTGIGNQLKTYKGR